MAFSKVVTRGKNVAGLPVVNTDSAPTGQASLTADNVFSFHVRAGELAAQRLAVGFVGPAMASPAVCAFYLWEPTAKAWLHVPAAAVTVNAGEVGFAAVPMLLDPSQGNAGGMSFAVVMTTAAPPDGTYTLLLGTDFGAG